MSSTAAIAAAAHRTILQVPKISSCHPLLQPQHKILSLGSCFATNMGQFLANHKFDCCNNPGGILFNPISMSKLLKMALRLESPEPSFRPPIPGVIPMWHHLDFHSDMNRSTQKEAQDNLHNVLTSIRERIRNLDWLILTFGTARVYTTTTTTTTPTPATALSRDQNDQNKSSNKNPTINQEEDTLAPRVVANCHQYPHHYFERKLITLEEMHQAWQPLLLDTLFQERPNLQIIVTVSPVRHTRDGLTENSISKALLRVFCEQLMDENIHYFPAYEIMMDDLRDYRYYSDTDFVHPNHLAQQYIWEKFQEFAMSEPTSQTQIKQWEQILKDLNHKPRYPNSMEHQKFLFGVLQKLQQQPSYIDTTKEQEQILSKLSKLQLEEEDNEKNAPSQSDGMVSRAGQGWAGRASGSSSSGI